MIFKPLIDTWKVAIMASDLDLPTKNVRRWHDEDSIPAGWFLAIARAARKRGYRHITEKHLATLAEERRIAEAERKAKPDEPARASA